MEGKERRKLLIDLLKNTVEPISGSELAKKLNVSRQIIVQDIALLRAENHGILSTTRGYLYETTVCTATRRIHVKHTTEEIEDELLTIVDHGGRVIDVIVSHGIYGEITTNLPLKSRQDVYLFVHQVKEKKMIPLKELTNNVHYHTIEADTEEILDQIEAALFAKKYLILEK